ncbi:MAG: NDP-sugar synthase, partial [Acidimicrobiia bacterium]
GRPESYLRANLDLVGGRRRDRDTAVHATATIASDATVHDSVVGARAVIEAGASVVGSVIFPGARVGAGARVSGSSVMGDVAASSTVRDELVGRD